MRSSFSRLVCSIGVGICLAALAAGCVSDTSGTASLTADNVKKIQKGVTTRRDIEAMFGPPQMTSMMDGGRHVLTYSFGETTGHLKPTAYIPIVNVFASGSESQVVTRSLQVNLNADDVVEDFQFNDSTMNVDRGGVFGESTTSTPVTSQSQSP